MVLKEEMKISEVSKFLILPYNQNRKLENLRSFASNFERSCDLDAKIKKINWDKNLKAKKCF